MDVIHLKYGLFLKRRFLPMFLATFFGAFNDNMLRNGLVVLIAYAPTHNLPLPIDKPAVMVTLCFALLVIPFIIFSSVAGQTADKFEKAQLVTFIKIVEIGIMLGAAYGFATDNIWLLMFLLFVSGTHSTFFGPIKYSILPEHLTHGELLAGNGFISGGSYLAVLAGLISGALLVNQPGNVIGMALVSCAVFGLVISFFIPRTHAAAPETELHFYLWRGTKEIIQFTRSSNTLFFSIIGLSWFLMIGSVFMSQFANYATEVVHADNEVYTLFLTIFSIGIAIGAVLADQILKGEITARHAPWTLLGISIFTYLMVFATPRHVTGDLLTVSYFINDIKHWPLLISLLAVAICGGIYMVPLYAMLQKYSDSAVRSRVIAASNMIDSLFSVTAAIICTILLSIGMGIPGLFITLGSVNLIAFFYARRHIPYRS